VRHHLLGQITGVAQTSNNQPSPLKQNFTLCIPRNDQIILASLLQHVPPRSNNYSAKKSPFSKNRPPLYLSLHHYPPLPPSALPHKLPFAIIPSTSAHQCSSTPHHHSHRLPPVLPITHPERDLPMHSMHTVTNPHSLKLINPGTFIKKDDDRLNF